MDVNTGKKTRCTLTVPLLARPYPDNVAAYAALGTDWRLLIFYFLEPANLVFSSIHKYKTMIAFLIPLSFATIAPPNLPDGWVDLGVESVMPDEEVKFVISGTENTASAVHILLWDVASSLKSRCCFSQV